MVLATTYVCSWIFGMTSNDSLPEGIDAHVHMRPSRLWNLAMSQCSARQFCEHEAKHSHRLGCRTTGQLKWLQNKGTPLCTPISCWQQLTLVTAHHTSQFQHFCARTNLKGKPDVTFHTVAKGQTSYSKLYMVHMNMYMSHRHGLLRYRPHYRDHSRPS